MIVLGRGRRKTGRQSSWALKSWQSGAASREGENLRRDSTEGMSEMVSTLAFAGGQNSAKAVVQVVEVARKVK